MARRLPPWSALEAFATAARTSRFKDAAARLAISAPALTRRIQALEHHLGARLFVRDGHRLELTDSGRRYLALLQPGVEAIETALRAMAPEALEGPLRLRVSHSLAGAWLAPRLSEFCDAHPGIELELHSGGGPRTLRDGGVDIGIYHGSGDWPDLAVARLFAARVSVVSAPRLADGRAPPASLADLDGYRLLGLSDPGGVWSLWSRAALPGARLHAAVTFAAAQPMYEAAAAGLGLAVGVRPLVSPFLRNGRLVEVRGTTVVWPGAYHMAAMPGTLRSSRAQAFWDWLRGIAKQAADD